MRAGLGGFAHGRPGCRVTGRQGFAFCHRACGAGCCGAGCCGEDMVEIRRARRVDRGKVGSIGQIPPARVAAGGEQHRAGGDGRIWHLRHGFDCGEGAGRDGFWRDRAINDLVDETGVCAVLQQPADEVSQEVTVRADRGVNATAGGVVGQHDVVQAFAHAVQALKFEGRGPAFGEVKDGGDGVRVVGGELRIKPVGHCQQLFGVGDVADIGRFLAGEDRERGEAQSLRAFDFGIPIGTLDQAHHDAAIQPGRQRIKPVDHRTGAAAVGLHDNAKTVPSCQRGVLQDRVNYLAAKLQPISLFGVDVEAEACGLCQPGKGADAGHKLGQNTVALGHFVARMQRGKLDRDAGVFADVAGFAGGSDGGDRARVGQVIAARVRFGAGGFAEHVVTVGIALRLHFH